MDRLQKRIVCTDGQNIDCRYVVRNDSSAWVKLPRRAVIVLVIFLPLDEASLHRRHSCIEYLLMRSMVESIKDRDIQEKPVKRQDTACRGAFSCRMLWEP